MTVTLAGNHYGKSGIRLLRVLRQDDRHDLKDLTLDIQFEGDFEAAHTRGDNTKILPADTIKNTVYALAKMYPSEQVEEFGLKLAEHFLEYNPQVSQARVEAVEQLWSRLVLGGQMQRSAFTRSGSERRTARVVANRQVATIEAGIEELALLKTAGSGFEGYIHDPFTTLPESNNTVLSTSISAGWRYATSEAAFGPCWHGVRRIILETFAEHESLSLQHTLYTIGETVLNNYDDIVEIRLALPNRHCQLVDLKPFGLDNPNEVFLPVDPPHDLIEATLRKSSG